MAHNTHAHAAATNDSASQKAKASALVHVVRDATERFHDVAVPGRRSASVAVIG